MPSGADIITYIGVPLAVLGVLPILWNSVRSFWIRHHLAAMIPAEARKNASLMIDPAGGVVVVVLDNLELRWQDVVRCGRQQTPLAARPVQSIDPQLAGCSWMGLYAAGVPFFKIKGSTQRVVVDASLRFEARGVSCDKLTLRLLALCLGVDPYRNMLHCIPHLNNGQDVVLCDADGKAVLNISDASAGSLAVQLCPDTSFSERRALAWFCIMVQRNKGRLLYIPLATEVASNIDFTTPPGIPTLKKGMEQLDGAVADLGMAMTWMCYTESIYYGERNMELLPVPQTILKAREDALAELKALAEDVLQSHVSAIFPGNVPLRNKILTTLKLAWIGITPEIENGKRKGRKRRQIEHCQTCIDFNSHISTNNVLSNLYNAVRPRAGNHPRPVLFNDRSPEIATAARIWLGLSVIQLWQREEWKTELHPDGLEVARPNLRSIRAILDECDSGLPQKNIYIS